MKRISAADAARLVADGWTVATAGFVGAGHAEAVTAALERRFLADGTPRGLTLLYAAGQGDRKHRGVNHFGHAGLVRRIIGGHWASAPKLGALVEADAVEAYNLPQGVISHLFRAIAGGKSGVVTKIGLHTFVDPRHDGARLTPRTWRDEREPRVELITLGGEEQLFYPSLPVHCALIRGTTLDERGNLACEREPFHQDLLAIAQAAHNSGGIVVAQAERVVPAGTLDPNAVRVPGILIDYGVIADDPAEHWMTFGEQFNAAYMSRPSQAPAREATAASPGAALDARRIVQRRAVLELPALRGAVVNLGVGMPAAVGALAQAEGHSDFTLTVEAGPIGGTPADALSFGASAYPEAIVDHAAQFDFYDGGGIDIAFLGMAELDSQGDVNVSRFGSRVAGVGGFVNITQSARRLVLMGTFNAGGLAVRAEGGRLAIDAEGGTPKLVPKVRHLSFNGAYAARLGTQVLYVTERAVFALREGRLTLVEVAPGIDVERDVLARSSAAILVADDLRTMDARIFRHGPLLG